MIHVLGLSRTGRDDRNRAANALSTSAYVLLLVVMLVSGLMPSAARAASGGEITQLRLSDIGGDGCKSAPVTFGLPFADGDLPSGRTLSAQIGGKRLPTQVDIKARNSDGSARHAVITVDAPCDDGARIALVAENAETPGQELSLSDVLESEFDAKLTLDIEGTTWHLDARKLLARVQSSGTCSVGETYCKRWLAGPLASEWVVGAPLEDAQGNTHPGLAAYFAVRAYGPAPVARVRVDTVVENTWAYASKVSNYRYSPSIQLAGESKTAYVPDAFTHYARARWHHVLWWGDSAQAPLYAQPDPQYLQNTPALPTYAKGRIASRLVQKARQSCAPMDHCEQTAHMGNSGAQAAIGPLPRWSAAFVIDPQYRVFRWMIANSDALGAYGMHFRERRTGAPINVAERPCASHVWAARKSECPMPTAEDRSPPYKVEHISKCKGSCKSPLEWNIAHHPAPTYVAYLSTGDWYYASEMGFVASWVAVWQNQKYRDYDKVLVHRTQLRGQAWMLRTLGYAAYLLPDDDAQKKVLNQAVQSNIDWYNKHFTNNPDAMPLGAITGYHAVRYPMHGKKKVALATWQQSFFTWSAGNLADLGFSGADDLRDWVSRFQIGLMTDPGFCWELATAYKLQVRDGPKAPFYRSFKEVFDNTFPNLADMSCDPKRINKGIREFNLRKNFNYPPGTMVGYPGSRHGFVANFQIGLAAAANANVPHAADAWNKFARRSLQADYSAGPQFAVVPTPKRSN